jgi:hypothetical protein
VVSCDIGRLDSRPVTFRNDRHPREVIGHSLTGIRQDSSMEEQPGRPGPSLQGKTAMNFYCFTGGNHGLCFAT